MYTLFTMKYEGPNLANLAAYNSRKLGVFDRKLNSGHFIFCCCADQT